MIINPIIPIWLMIIIIIVLFILIDKKIKKIIFQLILAIVLFAINLRPMVRNDDIKIPATNTDILFVIDNTISMIAEDYDGNGLRLDAVKNDCKYISEELYGSRFALVTFDNVARLRVPFTRDQRTFSEGIESMATVEYLYAHGSSLSLPAKKMKEFLERSTKKENTKTILFFITDGEINTENNKLGNEFSSLAKYIDGGAVLGYGTKEGGPMKKIKKYMEDGKVEYVMDETGFTYTTAISKIDEDNLKNISKQLKIDYINMNNLNNINSLLRQIKSGSINVGSEKNLYAYDDTYYYFVVPLFVLSVISYVKYRRDTL